MAEPSKLALSPIRLPAWVVTLITIVVAPLSISVLTGTDWKPVAVGCITGLVPMLIAAEVARTKVVPVVKHEAQVEEVRAVGYAAAVKADDTGYKRAIADVSELAPAAIEVKVDAAAGDAADVVAAAARVAEAMPVDPKPAKKPAKKAPAKKAAAKKVAAAKKAVPGH